MLISITEVQVSSAPEGKNYQIATVKYTHDGKPEERKIMSFTVPEVFSQLQALKSFPVEVNVILRKEGKYWNWTKLEMQSATKDSGGKVVGSNWETSEERARRQVYIIRQSSIASAINFLATKEVITVSEVLNVAKQFEEYVMDVANKPVTDGIPF